MLYKAFDGESESNVATVIYDNESTVGTKRDAITAPTTPVNNKVNKGLSELCNLRVIIR